MPFMFCSQTQETTRNKIRCFFLLPPRKIICLQPVFSLISPLFFLALSSYYFPSTPKNISSGSRTHNTHAYSPDAYLFEFKSAPGGIEAANERRQFEAAISGMKSVTVRQSFAVLLNGVSAQVSDKQELGQLMALDILKMVTPLVTLFFIFSFCETVGQKKRGR